MQIVGAASLQERGRLAVGRENAEDEKTMGGSRTVSLDEDYLNALSRWLFGWRCQPLVCAECSRVETVCASILREWGDLYIISRYPNSGFLGRQRAWYTNRVNCFSSAGGLPLRSEPCLGREEARHESQEDEAQAPFV
jgi:hypothetical protein